MLYKVNNLLYNPGMLHNISDMKYRHATQCEKDDVLDMDLEDLREKFLKAPVIMEDSTVYAVVEGVAYPLKEIAENSNHE